MTVLLAVLWVILASTGSVLLVSLLEAIRHGAGSDLVTIQACMALAFLLAIFLMGRVHANLHTLADFLGVRHTHPLLYVLAAPLGVALTIPAEILHRVIERKWPTPPDIVLEQIALLRMDTSLRRLTIPFVVIAIGPLVEELFFRGALFRGIRRLHPASIAIPMVAMLFAFSHMLPRAMLPLFLLGLFVTLLRASSGSIVPALIAHMSYNATLIFMELRSPSQPDPELTPLPASWSLGGVASALVLTAAFVAVAQRSSRALLARQEDSKP